MSIEDRNEPDGAQTAPDFSSIIGVVAPKPLIETGQLLTRLIEIMADGCIVTDKDGEIIFSNAAMSLLAQKPVEEIIGTKCTSYFGGELSAFVCQVCEESKGDCHRTFRVETELKRAAAMPLPVLINGVRFCNEEKKEIESICLLVTDIHLHVEREQRLSELDSLKNDFIAMVSHELNTPITACSGALSILSDEIFGNLNDEQRKYVRIAERNVERLSKLTTDLLAISRIETHRLRVELHTVDLRVPIMAACQSLIPMARERGIAILFPGAEASPAVAMADPDRVQQVVVNLVRNALRFAVSRVEVLLMEKSSRVLIVVRDDGPGVSAEDAERIFEKFYQGRETRNSGGGTGLGLAIVKDFVDAQEGEVWLETGSRYPDLPKGGGCFVVALPAAAAGGQAVQAATRMSPFAGAAAGKSPTA